MSAFLRTRTERGSSWSFRGSSWHGRNVRICSKSSGVLNVCSAAESGISVSILELKEVYV